TRRVFPSPGTPSTRTWPPEASPVSASSMISDWPTITRRTSAAIEARVAAAASSSVADMEWPSFMVSFPPGPCLGPAACEARFGGGEPRDGGDEFGWVAHDRARGGHFALGEAPQAREAQRPFANRGDEITILAPRPQEAPGGHDVLGEAA